MTSTVHTRPRIVIVGGGFVGHTVARRLRREARAGRIEVVLVDATGVMTYQPFLPEVAGGLIEPRHVLVPLRQTLPGVRVVTGTVQSVDRDARTIEVRLPDGRTYPEEYDHLVLAPGAVPRTRTIPGALGRVATFGTLADAIGLRDRVLTQIALAADTDDLATFRRALTFVMIGGGYSGVEAFAELQSLAVAAVRRHPNLRPHDLRWELIEAAGEVMPEMPTRLGVYTRRRLARSGIGVRLNSQVVAMSDGVLELSDGGTIDAGTVIWAAGVRAHPLMSDIGVPVDARGRLQCDPSLQVLGAPGVWAAGDGASVPDLSRGDDTRAAPLCAPTAQHAVRQARRLARNLLATLRGAPVDDYRHADAGSVASLGLHRGVAYIYRVPLRGLPAWLLHRAYHLAMMPTWGRRLRIAGDWAAALIGGRDVTPLPPGTTVEPFPGGIRRSGRERAA